jgi:branched-chain amino acid transport system ATP-binding protein
MADLADNPRGGGTTATPILETRGLSKSFGALAALSDVNLVVGEAEAIGIVGPNGAGKSTLLATLSGAYAPTAGSIQFCGQDVTSAQAPAMCRAGLVRTHQIPKPFGGLSVFENVFLGASFGSDLANDEAYDRAVAALELCGMLALSNRHAETLGLLDRKRLEVARAFATRPKILLLDEVGGGLTDAEAVELVDIIRAVQAQGTAIIWIEHIVHVLIQVAGRLICMDAGKVIADGKSDAVMSDPVVVEAYMGRSVT